MSFLLYCLGVFFFYYVFNYSDIAARCRIWVLDHVNEQVTYALGCSLCWTWWVSVTGLILGLIPAAWIFAAPVVNLFLIKLFQRL